MKLSELSIKTLYNQNLFTICSKSRYFHSRLIISTFSKYSLISQKTLNIIYTLAFYFLSLISRSILSLSIYNQNTPRNEIEITFVLVVNNLYVQQRHTQSYILYI